VLKSKIWQTTCDEATRITDSLQTSDYRFGILRQREKSANANLPSNSYAVNTNKLLLPIPQREITLDNLDQNPQ
jgi:hypothetical protein